MEKKLYTHPETDTLLINTQKLMKMDFGSGDNLPSGVGTNPAPRRSKEL